MRQTGGKVLGRIPNELKEYEAANAEYNSNESAITALEEDIKSEVVEIESEDPCL